MRYPQLKSCCLCLLIALVAPSARADVDDQARARYERAVKLYEEGVYDAALVELTRAYELRPSYKLLYNMAQVRLALKDYAAALEDFRRYLREAGDRAPPERRAAVEAEIARLEQRVAKLIVTSDVTGAEVLVDDVAAGTTPLAGPLIVNSGLRRVVVRHPDYPSQSVRVSIAGGEQQELALPLAAGTPPSVSASAPALEPRAESAPGSPPSEARAAPAADDVSPRWSPRHPRRARALAWGSTAALAATAVALGIAAAVQDGSVADERKAPSEDPAALEAKATRAERTAITSDVFTGLAVGAACVSLWLTLRTRGASEAATGTTELRLGPTGAALRTRF